MPDLLTAFAIVSVVLMVAALTSGLVDRIPISFPMIFLGLGFLIGPVGLRLIRIRPEDVALNVVGSLSLMLVLFLDAINLQFNQPRKMWTVPILSLGPGTLLTMLLAAVAAILLLKLPIILAFLLGAVLSSVDPVLLRDIVSDTRIPRSVRQSLQTEAGLNDIIVLPVLLILSMVARGEAKTGADWAVFLAELFLLGPLAGAVIGIVSAWLMEIIRGITDVRREFRAIYGVGVMLAAYAAGEAVGGSGFLAVFAAGAMVVVFDYDICDCFLDYSEVTFQMTMLLAFLMFGTILSAMIQTQPWLLTVLFALVVLLVIRPIVIGLLLRHTSISRQARRFIGWFGPRGLSSLLFGMLLMNEGVPGAEQVFAIAGIVVIISTVLHGVTAMPLAARYERAVGQEVFPEEREGSAAGLFQPDPTEVPRITPDELAERMASKSPPVVLDVRGRSSFERDPAKIPGSIRVPPDEVTVWGEHQSRGKQIVAYCT